MIRNARTATSEELTLRGRGKFGMPRNRLGNKRKSRSWRSAFTLLGDQQRTYLPRGILATKHLDASVWSAYKLRMPVTVHLAIGTDIPTMHPAADGAALWSGELQ